MAISSASGAIQEHGWPRRFNVTILMFLSVVILYMDRVNISVVAPVLMQELGWDQAMMGFVFSFFFLGYFLSQIPGGWFADRWGSKRLLGGAVVWWSLMTMLTPFARSVSTMLVVRVSLGIGEGLSPPSLYSTIARWIPAAERSRAMAFVATGMYVGLIIAFPTAVWIMTRLGWPWVFYLFGLLGLAWWVAWHLLVTDRPEDHPSISEAEIQTILHGQASTPQAEAIPWRRFFREPAFLALICAHFSTNWTYYIFLTWLPTYLVQVRQFSLQEMGLYATFPYVAMMVIGNGAAWVADGMIQAGTSVTRVRKLFQTVAFLGATVFLLLLTVSESQWLTVACITLGLGALSCFASGMGVNHLDIGPKYAGALVGITNTAATLPGILAPFLTGLIVQLTGNWNMVFYLAAGVMVVGMLIWNLFATGETLFE